MKEVLDTSQPINSMVRFTHHCPIFYQTLLNNCHFGIVIIAAQMTNPIFCAGSKIIITVVSSFSSVIYGVVGRKLQANDTWDGNGTQAKVVSPEHLHQSDNMILFVDTQSCARLLSRHKESIRTIFGML